MTDKLAMSRDLANYLNNVKASMAAAKNIDEQISRFVNNLSDGHRNAKALGSVMTQDHRTLVQIKMHIIMSFLKKLKQDYEEGRYDARNKVSCKLAVKMLGALGQHDDCLPFI
jgi:hypothetical protein